MIVRYLDLKTGRKAEDNNINEFDLTLNNWSCDCNRQNPFNVECENPAGNLFCLGCTRFIVYDVEPEEGEIIDKEEVIRKANLNYYETLKHGS